VVLSTGDILCGKTGAAPSDVLAATADWGTVHGPQFSYDLIAAYRLERIRLETRSKRARDSEDNGAARGAQRSRGLSFTDGVNSRSRTAPGTTLRFREQLISYPINPRSGGRRN